MRNKKMYAFLLVAFLQLLVPLIMIWNWEQILLTGRQYYWHTAPIDPYDLFRGKYVAVNVPDHSAPILADSRLEPEEKAYAIIAIDQEGYAYISGVTALRPADIPYITVKVNYISENKAYFNIPFKRFYMREDLAPAAENAFRVNSGKTGAVLVRIKNGDGVIEDLFIDNKPINEYLRDLQ